MYEMYKPKNLLFFVEIDLRVDYTKNKSTRQLLNICCVCCTHVQARLTVSKPRSDEKGGGGGVQGEVAEGTHGFTRFLFVTPPQWGGERLYKISKTRQPFSQSDQGPHSVC